MRFLSVGFRNFGPFADQTFDLSQGRHGLHLIHGRNEAGKSSALRGLRYFLFGFPERTKDDFTYNKTVFRIHATLANTRGDVLECVRRKGRKETLRAGDDKTVLSDETLRAFIGGLSEEQFIQLFGLDHQLLDEGGRLIAEGKGNLGEAIFAAGAGIAGLRGIQDRLEKAKIAIYKVRGHTQLVPIALKKLKELQDEVRLSSLAAEAYAAKEEEFRAAQSAAEQTRLERDRARADQSRLERYRTALPTIGQLRDARARLRPVEAARTLAVGFEKEYRDTWATLLVSRTTWKDVSADIAKLEGEIKALELPAALLAEEDTIEKLKERVAVWSKEKEEALKSDTRKREMEAKARDLFRGLTGSTDLEQAKTYRLTVEQTNRIRALGRDQALLEGELNNHANLIQKLQRQITDTERTLEQSPATEDPSRVRRVVDLVTAEGRLEEQLSQVTQACAQEESKIRDSLAALIPTCSTPVEGMTALPLPQPEVVEWHRQELGKLKKQSDESATELRQARHELIALERQVESFQRGEAIPSSEELAERRQDRDSGLFCVRQRLAGHSSTNEDAQFINRFAPTRTLIDAVEVSVRQCDTLADRLRREADRVVRWHGLQSEREEMQKKIALAEVDLERRNADLERAQTHWRELWQASGIVPEIPEAMSGWLVQVNRLRERIEAWQISVRQRVELAARCEQHFAWLVEALPEVSTARSLQDGLATAREQVKVIEELRNERKKHAVNLEGLRRDLATAQLDRTKTADRMQTVQQEWAKAVALLQLPPTVDILTVETCLTRADEMQEHLKDARIKAALIREIELDQDALLQSLNELRLRIEPTCRTTTVDWIEKDFAELDGKLSVARNWRTQYEQIRKQIASKLKAREVVANEQRDAEAKLATMAAEAGVADPRELPDAIERFRRRSEAVKHVHDLETAVAQQARGIPIQQFEEAALAQSEGIEAEMRLLEEKIAQADRDLAQADIAANQAEVQLKEWRKASEAAAKARQDAALWARRLQDNVAEYTTLHLARVVLDRAVERYRSRNQDSMLARAGAFFRQLTDGDFDTLEIENEDGKPVLKALRSDHARLDARVFVDGLSDGTRDQLFLALRLAGIEQHLTEREPMPLIIDDVLINFDDGRACATLRCIAELSKQTQVLLFTHHRHILDLARESVPSQLVTHEFRGVS